MTTCRHRLRLRGRSTPAPPRPRERGNDMPRRAGPRPARAGSPPPPPPLAPCLLRRACGKETTGWRSDSMGGGKKDRPVDPSAIFHQRLRWLRLGMKRSMCPNAKLAGRGGVNESRKDGRTAMPGCRSRPSTRGGCCRRGVDRGGKVDAPTSRRRPRPRGPKSDVLHTSPPSPPPPRPLASSLLVFSDVRQTRRQTLPSLCRRPRKRRTLSAPDRATPRTQRRVGSQRRYVILSLRRLRRAPTHHPLGRAPPPPPPFPPPPLRHRLVHPPSSRRPRCPASRGWHRRLWSSG